MGNLQRIVLYYITVEIKGDGKEVITAAEITNQY